MRSPTSCLLWILVLAPALARVSSQSLEGFRLPNTYQETPSNSRHRPTYQAEPLPALLTQPADTPPGSAADPPPSTLALSESPPAASTAESPPSTTSVPSPPGLSGTLQALRADAPPQYDLSQAATQPPPAASDFNAAAALNAGPPPVPFNYGNILRQLSGGHSVKKVCQFLQSHHGEDICGAVSVQKDHKKPPSKKCAGYNAKSAKHGSSAHPYMYEAVHKDPVGCFKVFKSQCGQSYNNPQDETDAFGNWIVNYMRLMGLSSNGNVGAARPNCRSTVPQDTATRQLTGATTNAPQAPTDGNIPNSANVVDPSSGGSKGGGNGGNNGGQGGAGQGSGSTSLRRAGPSGPAGGKGPGLGQGAPPRLDWRERNAVTPITSQTQSTCYIHASVACMGSIALITNPTDRTGRVQLTPNMTLSVQPFVDCMPGQDGGDPCNGGRVDDVLGQFSKRPVFNTIDFPDVDGATQPPSCRIDGDPKCESTRSNVAAGKLPFWQLPDSFAFTPTSLSEAQLVQVLQKGPVVGLIGASDLMYNWQPFPEPGKVKPFRGELTSDPQSFCSNEVNHGILIVGYDFTDPDNAYFIIRNSWGPNSGDRGFLYAGAANPSSPQFTDQNYKGTCGLLSWVYPWTI